jgi:hypothetical protein
MNQAYLNSIRLLLAVDPPVFRRPALALKGGTSINLFLRDMPRLSINLDLVFTGHRSLKGEAIQAISTDLQSNFSGLFNLSFSRN